MDKIGSPWDAWTKIYERTLDVRGAIHGVVAANVANEETPGYRAMHLPFKEALDSAMNGTGPLTLFITHPNHSGGSNLDNPQFLRVMAPLGGSGMDGNTVNLEQQMTLMAENSLLYMAVGQFLTGQMNGWKSAIKEGR